MTERTLKEALSCSFEGGSRLVPRGAKWGVLLGLPVGLYCCATLPYGAGLVLGPVAPIVAVLAGALIAFFWGATAGLYRAGYRWALLLIPLFGATLVCLPYSAYLDAEWAEQEQQRLLLQVQSQDSGPLLARLSSRRSRRVAREHLVQLLVCAGPRSNTQVIDALAALDPHGKQGVALCAVAQHGQAAALRHLLEQGYQPRHAHWPSGQPCQPLVELAAASTSSAPCSVSPFGELDSFAATLTSDGCKHRAEAARALLDAGASTEGGVQVFDPAEQPAGGAARTVDLAELVRKSQCDELVEVVARGGKP